MIVWVNGAFGSGKTTLVGEVSRRWPAALVHDPEQIGYVLRDIVDVPTGNFQDLPLWRRQAAAMAVGLAEEYARPVLAPMTLVNPGHLAEIFTAVRAAGLPVHHFYLRVSPEVLARRIDTRVLVPGDPEREAEVRRWCKAQIGPCAAGVAGLLGDTVFLDGERPSPELAEEVLRRVGSGVGGVPESSGS